VQLPDIAREVALDFRTAPDTPYTLTCARANHRGTLSSCALPKFDGNFFARARKSALPHQCVAMWFPRAHPFLPGRSETTAVASLDELRLSPGQLETFSDWGLIYGIADTHQGAPWRATLPRAQPLATYGIEPRSSTS
jgi:hypothetical protein